MHNALFRAFFEEGRDIGDEDVLLDGGGSVGLEREGLRVSLDEGRYTEKVVSDERLATRLGVDSVPTMFLTREGASLEEAEKITGALGLTAAGASRQPWRRRWDRGRGKRRPLYKPS